MLSQSFAAQGSEVEILGKDNTILVTKDSNFIEKTFNWISGVSDEQTVDNMIQFYEKNPNVEFAQKNCIYEIPEKNFKKIIFQHAKKTQSLHKLYQMPFKQWTIILLAMVSKKYMTRFTRKRLFLSKNISENGEISVHFSDANGNNGNSTINILHIDKTKPSLNISFPINNFKTKNASEKIFLVEMIVRAESSIMNVKIIMEILNLVQILEQSILQMEIIILP